MEKLIFALWAPDGRDVGAWQSALRTQAVQALEGLGAQRLKLCVADVPAPENDPYTDMKADAPGAYISFWLNSTAFWRHGDAMLAQFAPRRAAYAVAESTILPLTRPLTGGERAPGVLQIAAFATHKSLDRGAMLRAWLEDHTAVAVETQSTTTYTQNVVTRPLSADAPGWDGIVEETFPTAALTDRHIYFATGGSADVLARHETRMAESCQRFIDFTTLKLIMASEYRFGGWADSAFGFHQDRAKQKGG